VGEEVGLTREMVRQIKEKNLGIIKKTFVGWYFSQDLDIYI
jgi:hypothetical protein